MLNIEVRIPGRFYLFIYLFVYLFGIVKVKVKTHVFITSWQKDIMFWYHCFFLSVC